MHPTRNSGYASRAPSSLNAALFGWRDRPDFGILETFALTLWAALVAFVIPYHERWADEVQAWYLATDSTVWDILRHRMHYEGAPPLWHLILHLFHALGGTVFGMNWLGAAFAGAAVFVLLRWSPFPLVLRILLPFTFFLAYQYAIIARGYTLFALLSFTLCALYPRRQHWFWFAITAGLLANLSLQGAVFSFVLLALYLLDWKRASERDTLEASSKRARSGPWRSALVFLPFLIVAGLVAMPAPDVNFAVSTSVSDGVVHRMLVRFPGELPRTMPNSPPNPPLPPQPDREEPVFQLFAPSAWLGWYPFHRNFDAAGRELPQSWTEPALEGLLGVLAQATWPVATSRLLACVFLLSLMVWLRAMRFLRGILIWGTLVLVGQILWVSDHHTGMLLVTLVAVVWLARERWINGAAPESRTMLMSHSNHALPGTATARIEDAFLLLFTLIAALQVQWTAVSMWNDVHASYAPGRDTAAILHQRLQANPQARIAGFDSMDATVQPYFDHNPYFNMPHRYWVWSETDNPNAQHQPTIASHPDVVVFTDEMIDPGVMRNTWALLSEPVPAKEQRDLTQNPIVNDLRAHGYMETHRFCGHRFSRSSSSFYNCHLIFEPGASSQAK